MKKLLIVSGDSYTANNYKSILHPELDTSWPMWPELLADRLNMECINLANEGSGNEFIYSSLLDKINTIENKKSIGLVLAAWSQAQRKDFEEGCKIKKWKSYRIDSSGDIFGWTRKSIRNFINLQLLCEYFNLPYKQFQMIRLYEDYITGLRPSHKQIIENNYDGNYRLTYNGNKSEDIISLFNITTEYKNTLNIKNFLGWPIIEQFSGYSIANKVLKTKINNIDVWDSNLIISDLDHHPNAKGQQKLMEYIYDRLG